MKKRKRRGLRSFIAAALCFGLIFPQGLPTAYAARPETGQKQTLCEHHLEHNEECGFTEGSQGTPCTHEHTEECYALVTECVHEHTEDCYPAEDLLENIATPSEPTEMEPTECTHECSEESGCITEKLNCQHEQSGHDRECGYSLDVEGTPCKFVCEICNQQDSGASEAVTTVQAQIDALPAAKELQAMTKDEQNEVYADLQKAYDAYEALTDEQKAQITGAEIFDSLFDVFNRMAKPLIDHRHPVCIEGDCTDPNHENGHDAVIWTAWNETDAMPDRAGNYYLTADATVSATWEVPAGETKICLNGHDITYSNTIPGSVIKVPQNVELTISDCTQTPGKITGGSGKYYKEYVGYNPEIDGYYGGGIAIEGGKLKLYGGSVAGNEVTVDTTNDSGYSGGVFNKNGTFNMYGGTITENITTGEGSAVFCFGGAFNLYGGEITKNEMEEDFYGWGAVLLSNGAKMSMGGGEISANEGGYTKVGVMSEDSELIVSGTALITDHEWGVYCDGGFFSMEGGKVASIQDSVMLSYEAEMTMTGGEISSSGGHGIYMSLWANPLTVSGGKITGANSGSSYGICIDRSNEEETIRISGNPEISSIYLPCLYVGSPVVETTTSLKLAIEEKLSYQTPISITMKEPGQFTNGWEAQMGTQAENFADYFTMNNEKDYEMTLAEGELYLIPLETEHLHDGSVYGKKMSALQAGGDGVYAITESSNYYLDNDYAVPSGAIDHTIYIGDGKKAVTVNLCLNGYALSHSSGGYSGPVIIVRENATLNLYDCEETGKITGGTGRTAKNNEKNKTYSYGGGMMVYGELNMYGGSITGNSAEAEGASEGYGGGVYVASGGTYNFYGGRVTNNTAKTSGGGITVAGADDAAPVSEPIRIPFGSGSAGIDQWNGGSVFEGEAELNSVSLAVQGLRSNNRPGMLNLHGGSVTDNTSNIAAGINVRGEATVEKGAVLTVTENMANRENSNLYFPAAHTNLAVKSIPAEGSFLSVRMEVPGQFALMSGDMEEEAVWPFFGSDDSAYGVLTMTDGLKLVRRYPMPAVSVDYRNENLTGFEPEGSYIVNGSAAVLEADGTLKIDSEWFGSLIAIVRTGEEMADSSPQTISIPARPAAPVGLTAYNTSTGSTNDGKITGLDSANAYQYSSDGTNWTDIPAGSTELTGLAAGTYYVRLAAVENVCFASASATLTVQKSTTPVIPGDTVRYIVEHYKADPNSSTGYALADTEYPVGKIGETVTAASKTYQGYTCNTEKSTARGELKEIKSESDILVLKLYYDLTEFTVTVETDGHGSAFASSDSAVMGETITLTAKADSGYRFKEWETVSGGVSVSADQFVMPAEAVSVKAIFEKIPGGGETPGGGESSGGSSSDDSDSSGSSGGSLLQFLPAGVWIRDSVGWWYRNIDGAYPASCWQRLAYENTVEWYRFDERGYMQTGWFTDADGRTYYLHDVSDGRQGYMYTGWHQIDGVWYYFGEVQDGTEGVLYKNTRTPDGYMVDENGAWKP